MTTIAELRLREFVRNLKEREKLTASEVIQILDKEKRYFMRVTESENLD